MQASLQGDAAPRAIDLSRRGSVRRVRGISAVANLAVEIAERQRRRALSALRHLQVDVQIDLRELPAASPGTLLLLLVECEHSQACFFALGARGKPAERVADEASGDLLAFLDSGAAVDPWIADQLLLPLAIAQGKTQMLTSRVTGHLLTNASVIRHFLPVRIAIEGAEGGTGMAVIDQSNGCE